MILLSTINAKYQHTSFGLRYLYSNLGPLQPLAQIREYTIKQSIESMAQDIVSAFNQEMPCGSDKTQTHEFSKPISILGLGVYIWNAEKSLALVKRLKELLPNLIIVIGGPEVTYEYEDQEIFKLSDFLIRGEGDFLFYSLCQKLLAKSHSEILPKVLSAIENPPEISNINLPYAYYSDHDIQTRVVYVEASRGCPYKCEYCLSSLDKSVRHFPIDQFLKAMGQLIDRGVREFKFVDRTFNLHPKISLQIVDFFLEKIKSGINLFLHFEMVPDRLPEELKSRIEQFPKGALQFEVGIQTLNPTVAALVSRRLDIEKTKENLTFLHQHTKVHIHADLIFGLPGESLTSFQEGFDLLASWGPHEIQLGILKRLKGAPIIRHTQTYELDFAPTAPYAIRRTKDITPEQIEFIDHFASYWNHYVNSGYFSKSIPAIFQKALPLFNSSTFLLFEEFVKFLNIRFPVTHSIPLAEKQKALWDFALATLKIAPEELAEWMLADLHKDQQRHTPHFLKAYQAENRPFFNTIKPSMGGHQEPTKHLLKGNRRQQRH